jgi:AraC-like DNA-binding protein
VISTIVQIKFIIDVSNLLFTAAVYTIGYFGIRQPEIFFYDSPPQKELNEPGTKKKYAGSTLTFELAQKYAAELVTIVQNQKIYLNSELKLVDLAEKVTIPPHHLSQVINEQLQKNFSDFINEFRVRELKERLLSDKYKHFTILAIGLECGFNSKAAINSIFKAYTGISPSAFRKQHTNE